MELVKSVNPEETDLDYFIDFLFNGLTGFTYLVAKEPGESGKWNSSMFQYPEQVDTLKHYIRVGFEKYEIFLAPVLYHTDDNARRENVKVTNVVWTEFDGNSPSEWTTLDTPSLLIQSSTEDHTHAYWKLARPITTVDEIEDITHRISFNLRADLSAWDATQVLRPPGTLNHKRSLNTFIKSRSDKVYDLSIFDALPKAPKVEGGEWNIGSLPNVEDVLLKYPFTPELQKLIKLEKAEEHTRSSKMMQFAFAACELGLTDVEVFVLLKALDDRWGKFVGRRDRDKRLAGIITHARNKYPEPDVEAPYAYAMGYMDFMAKDIEIDWVMEPMLMENGRLLLTGPSGVGKTQFLLEIMKHIALGKDFLHYKVPEPKKILFPSLEMGHGELKVFLKAQDTLLDSDERQMLQENFIIIPHGEAWPLNIPGGQQILHKFIEEKEPDGLFIDSIGSAILGNINNQEAVQSYLNYLDHTIKKYNLFWGAIHHNRKKVHGQGASTQDDVYGDQYLVNRSSSVYGMLFGRDGLIRVEQWKARLSSKEEPYYIKRMPSMTFETVNADIATGTIGIEIPTDDAGNISTKAGPYDL